MRASRQRLPAVEQNRLRRRPPWSPWHANPFFLNDLGVSVKDNRGAGKPLPDFQVAFGQRQPAVARKTAVRCRLAWWKDCPGAVVFRGVLRAAGIRPGLCLGATIFLLDFPPRLSEDCAHSSRTDLGCAKIFSGRIRRMSAVRATVPAIRRQRFNPRRIIVAPSILSADFADLKGELRRCLRARCSWIHVDVMDGHFVPNLTIGPLVVEALRKVSKQLFLDAHLMIEKPLQYAEAFAQAGAQLITIHQETVGSVRRALRHIKQLGVMAGLSIKPRTSVAAIEPFLDEIDLALVMTVEPGFGGQELIPATLNKVRRLALQREESNLSFHIQVDGGINAETAPLATAAGANVLVAGSFIFDGMSVEQNVERLYGSLDPSLNGHGLVPR